MDEREDAMQSTNADSRLKVSSSNKRPRAEDIIEPKALFQNDPKKRLCSQDISATPQRSIQSGNAKAEVDITVIGASPIKNLHNQNVDHTYDDARSV